MRKNNEEDIIKKSAIDIRDLGSIDNFEIRTAKGLLVIHYASSII